MLDIFCVNLNCLSDYFDIKSLLNELLKIFLIYRNGS